MKIKSIVVAMAAAGALASQASFAALTPASAVGAVEVFVSGATALDNQFVNYSAQLCDANNAADPLVFLSNSASVPGNLQTAILCRASGAALPTLAGQVIVVYKRSEGGSGWGVGPVSGAAGPDGIFNNADDQTIRRLSVTGCDATADGTKDLDPANPSPLYNVFTCTGTELDSPIAGISDVEPSMFKGPNLIDASLPENVASGVVAGDPGTVALTTAQLNALDIFPMNATTFGIVVTTQLRDELQRAQGLAVGSDAESAMPSLSRSEIASLFAGKIPTWDKFFVGGQRLTDFVPAAERPSNLKVQLCRRSPGSGTQAQFNALFMNSPCNEGANAPARDNTNRTWRIANGGVGPAVHNNIGLVAGVGNVPVTAPAVHENQGSGDVDRCMLLLNQSDDTTLATDANYRWGVGIQSLERGSADMRFVKIDGIAPTTANVANNKYFDWAGATMQWPRFLTTDNVAHLVSDDQMSILEALRDNTVDPAAFAVRNAGFNPRITGANVGNLATTPRYLPNFPFDINEPVMTASRDFGGKPNTCSAVQIVDEAGL